MTRNLIIIFLFALLVISLKENYELKTKQLRLTSERDKAQRHYVKLVERVKHEYL